MNRPRYERKLLALALVSGFPSLAAVIWLLHGHYPARIEWTVGVALALFWLAMALMLHRRVVRPMQTVGNLLAALREGDFSVRGHVDGRDGAFAEVLFELNQLAATLRQERLGAVEANALVAQVMEVLDVAIFAFDPEERLRLVNRAGERLVGQAAAALVGRTAGELGLADCLRGDSPRTVELPLAGGGGPFELRRHRFRQDGVTHQLVALPDLRRALREEERAAWQRLLRVLGHEINNSLAPIQSISHNLQKLLSRTPPPADRDDDVARGLQVIGRRAEALGRFTVAFARLAKLPPPKRQPVDVAALVARVVALEKRLAVQVEPGPAMELVVDPDQLEQLLINLVKNGADAVEDQSGSVRVRWSTAPGRFELCVEDEGGGLGDSANLFVPFFTTKPHGTGIGLVLSRQIAEAHDGTLVLENRVDRSGCRARLVLPTGIP